MLHKNSFKRFYGKDYVYFVVIKTKNNLPYFREPIFCDLFVEEMRISKEIKNFKLYAFSIIYDHINLLIQPNDEYDVSKIMHFTKRHFSRDMNFIIGKEKLCDVNSVGDIRECRLQESSYLYLDNVIKYHDKIIKKYKNQFNNKFISNSYPKFHWQKSFYDHVIRNETDFNNHFSYTIFNPDKHNLPSDWKYSSLNFPDIIDSPDI